MNDDFALLQKYVHEKSDGAFETLASRYLDLIHSAAVRMTGDGHTAEDVTQAVLLVLARKAPELPESTVLPAWLLTTTRLTALRALRTQTHQRKLVQAAAQMNSNPMSDHDLPGAWSAVAPHLDEALADLNEEDRAAVVLRYFQRGSNDDVARRLNISTVAAEKRVTRAVEKMRRFFSSRGVSVSCVVLASLLGAQAVQAAPAAFAAIAVKSALAAKAAGAATTASLLADGVIKSMALAKTTLLLVAVGVLALGALLLLTFNFLRGPAAIPLKAAAVAQFPAAPVEEVAAPVVQDAAPGVVDLLPMINLENCVVNGNWRREDSDVVSDRTAYARVEIPYDPPEEYDFKISFTVLEPYADVTQILSRNERMFCWKMGAENRFCVFEQIDGEGYDNYTRYLRPDCFKPGERHESVVQVRRGSVAAFMDGEFVRRFETDFTNVSLFDFYQLRGRHRLGLGSWCTPVRFHEAKVVEISARGQPIRFDRKIDPPLKIDPDAWKNARNLMPLIDTDRDTVAGRWRLEAGGLSCDEFARARLEIPYRPPEEYLYRVVFTRNSGDEAVAQILGHDTANFAWVMASEGKFNTFDRLNPYSDRANPTLVLSPNTIVNGVRHTAVVHVNKDGFTSFVDGKLISRWTEKYRNVMSTARWEMTSAGLLGLGCHASSTMFHSIEVLELSGPGGVEIPDVSRRQLLKEKRDAELRAKPNGGHEN